MKLTLLANLTVCTNGSAAFAQTFTLQATADAFLVAANPGSNYGGGGALSVSAAGLPKGEFDSLLRFDAAAAKSNFDALYGAGLWTVQSISLTLTASAPNNPLFNGNGAGPGGSNVNTVGLFNLEWVQNDTWIEGTGTPSSSSATGIAFSGLPALRSGADEALGTFSFAGGTTGSAVYHLALTHGFVADFTAGNEVTFLAEPADTSIAMLVNSRTGTISGRPTLTVVAVPEPVAAALLAAGALGWMGRRRRAALAQ